MQAKCQHQIQPNLNVILQSLSIQRNKNKTFFFFEYWVSNIVHHNPPLLWMKPIHTCALAWFVYEDTGGSLRPAETPLMWSGTRVNVLTGGSLSFSKNRRGFDEKEKRARSWFSLSWENKSSQFEPCLFFYSTWKITGVGPECFTSKQTV